MRMVSETSFLSNDARAGLEIIAKELDYDRTYSINEGNDSEEESPKETRPAKKLKISNRVEVESYAINFIKCETTQKDLDRLRKTYNITSDIDLKIPNKNNTLTRPSKGYVNFYL